MPSKSRELTNSVFLQKKETEKVFNTMSINYLCTGNILYIHPLEILAEIEKRRIRLTRNISQYYCFRHVYIGHAPV